MSIASFGHRSRRLAAVVMLGLLTVAACRDATRPEPEATFTGRLAGAPWEGEARASFVTTGGSDLALVLSGSAPIGLPQPFEVIVVSVAFDEPGRYVLGPGDVRFMLLLGGDVLTAEYRSTMDEAGVLEIAVPPGDESFYEGTLSFTLDLVEGHPTYGTRVEFTDGWFRVPRPPPVL